MAGVESALADLEDEEGDDDLTADQAQESPYRNLRWNVSNDGDEHELKMTSDSLGENEAEKNATDDFFISVTIPVLIQEGEQFGVAATGTLFKIANRHFLVTAAHTYETYHPNVWHLPSHPRQGAIHSRRRFE